MSAITTGGSGVSAGELRRELEHPAKLADPRECDVAPAPSKRRSDAWKWRSVAVLLIGDLDPSAASIMDSTAEDVLAFTAARLIEFARLAVTEEQAEEFALVSAPQKSTDRRGAYMAETYQAEALDPADLADIVREALLELIHKRFSTPLRTRAARNAIIC